MWGTSPFTHATTGLVETGHGKMHYVMTGDKGNGLTPLIAMHMSPRSTDEYREVQQLFEKETYGNRCVVAVDELGYGSSEDPRGYVTMKEEAEGVLKVVDALGITNFSVTGSLRGAYLAMQLAADHPTRVEHCILTNPYRWTDEAVAREQAKDLSEGQTLSGAPADMGWNMENDGSHLAKIFQTRSSWLEPEMGTRICIDASMYKCKRPYRYAKGSKLEAPQLFAFDETAKQIVQNVLIIIGEDAKNTFDRFGMSGTSQFNYAKDLFDAHDNATVVTIKDKSNVNIVNTNADEWTAAVDKFLR